MAWSALNFQRCVAIALTEVTSAERPKWDHGPLHAATVIKHPPPRINYTARIVSGWLNNSSVPTKQKHLVMLVCLDGRSCRTPNR